LFQSFDDDWLNIPKMFQPHLQLQGTQKQQISSQLLDQLEALGHFSDMGVVWPRTSDISFPLPDAICRILDFLQILQQIPLLFFYFPCLPPIHKMLLHASDQLHGNLNIDCSNIQHPWTFLCHIGPHLC